MHNDNTQYTDINRTNKTSSFHYTVSLSLVYVYLDNS